MKTNIWKRIIKIVFLSVMLYWIYGLFIAPNNTFIYITNNSVYDNYCDDEAFTDISLYIDEKLILEDTIKANQEWKFGKLFSFKLLPGFRELRVKSKKYNSHLDFKLHVFYKQIIFIRFSSPENSNNLKQRGFVVFDIDKKIGSKLIVE